MSARHRHRHDDDRPTGDDASLSVQVGGGRGEPERLFVLSRPRGGQVDVREFRFGSEELAPREYTAAPHELLEAFERAHGERRRLSEDLYRIRLWLEGSR